MLSQFSQSVRLGQVYTPHIYLIYIIFLLVEYQIICKKVWEMHFWSVQEGSKLKKFS
jgi:hypothetical protein